jgi:signal transduction histidine kinase/ligand-binding sensor domain-containing protein
MKLWYIFFLSILLGKLDAQNGKSLRFERVDGLSQNTVYSIMKDKQGFMWIATANGLNRYDGVEMKVYKPGISYAEKQMKGRFIRSDLLEDEKEQIWFSTDVTVNCFDKRKSSFSNYKLFYRKGKKNSNESRELEEMFANPLLKSGNELWLANSSEGLFVLNTSTNKVSHYPLTIKDEAGSLVFFIYNGVFDGRNKFWFASKKGLLSFDTLTKSWKQYLEKLPFYTVTLFEDTLLAGSNDNVAWVDTRSFTTGKVPLNATPEQFKKGMIRRLYLDKNGNTWAGDQEGNVYSKALHASAFSWRGNINGNSPSVTNLPVYCFYADEYENLWVGADVLGLLKTNFASKVFNNFPQSFTEATPNKSIFVYSIYEDENDRVWLGTFQNGLIILDKKTNTTEKVALKYSGPPLIYENTVPLVKKDSYGNLWTSSNGQLYVKEKNSSSFLTIKIPVPSNALQTPQMRSIAEYKEGWLIGTNIGLYYMVKKKAGYDLLFLKHFGQSRVNGTWVNGNKEVWLIIDSKGIIVVKDMDEAAEQKRIFSDANVKSVQHDAEHELLWIATSAGLIAYHLPTGAHRAFGEDDGLANSYIYGVVTHNDELWLSTNNGLSCGKTAYTNGSVFPDITFTNFTKADGLSGNEFNTGAFYKAANGTLYFGTTQGVVWFNPSQIKSNIQTPKLQLVNLLVNDEIPDSTIAPEYITRLNLPYNENNIFFRFRGIDFNNGAQVKYMYQLEGWDKKWINSKELNEVRYNNLAPDNYIFKVKASNGSGKWSKDEYRVAVNIAPPFWGTWWFRGFIFLLLLGSIVMLTKSIAQRKLRKQLAALEKQRELDKERQRISREMHDDIGAGLTQIVLMSESAKGKKSGNSEKELTEITNTSRKLVNNMGEIIWSLNPENKTLEQLMAHLREQLHHLLEYSGIAYNIHLPENGKNILLPNEMRRNILLITMETVHNAVKYSNAKNIEVNALLNNGVLTFTVRDDGIGFDTEKLNTGNGLKNIRHRVNEMHGQLHIESAENLGSRFSYTIPIKPTT